MLTGIVPIVVGSGIKTGLNILIDNPAQLGSDLVVGGVAALASYKPPIIICDMGTATTISVMYPLGVLSMPRPVPVSMLSHSVHVQLTPMQ